MPDMGAGTTLFHYATTVATVALSPLVPNAAVVRRIVMANASASDTWTIRTNGQEVGRFFQGGSSAHQAFPDVARSNWDVPDIFAYCSRVLGIDLIYPVPEGKTITIASVGGATADIIIEYEEFTPSALTPSLCNYPGGGYWVAPVWFSLAAHPTTTAEKNFDTEVGLEFAPKLFTGGSFPVGWSARILDLFLQGAGYNAYASSTNHQSHTTYVAAKKSGQRLFTRDALGGIPNIGPASAAGSANVVVGSGEAVYPPLYTKQFAGPPNLDAPIVYRSGFVYEWAQAFTGDVGAGADYSTLYNLAIVEYRSS